MYSATPDSNGRIHRKDSQNHRNATKCTMGAVKCNQDVTIERESGPPR